MFFYSLLLSLALPFICLRLLWKSRQNPDYRRRWAERFACQLPPPLDNCLLVHCVSVGEFLTLKPLLIYWLEREPVNFWLCCTTPTGSAQIMKFVADYPQRLRHSYLPYDQPWFIGRFLRHLRPRAVILMETEIWPNLISRAHALNLPVILENARLSARSCRRYRRYLSWLLPRIITPLKINGQNRATARRFRHLGARTVRISPSLKFYSPPRPALDLAAGTKPIWLWASTHPNEEEQLLEIYKRLNGWQLVIAPRHPERRTEIAALLERSGLKVRLRSRGEPLGDVYLLDTLGELASFYGLARVAFIGGSLVERGGHNPLEALHRGTPVCFGPSMFNFQEISEEIRRQPFAVQVQRPEELPALLPLLARWKNAPALVDFAGRHKDLLERHLQVLREFIGHGLYIQ